MPLKRLFNGLFSGQQPRRAGAPGFRAYAIGDVHGRLDLLDDILARIEADAARRPPKPTYLIFLGDLVDRGPESRGVIERVIQPPIAGMTPVYLMGNHEEAMLAVLDGQPGILWNWLRFGGSECIASYGLEPVALEHMSEDDAVELIRRVVPPAHRRFLASFADTFSFGDYLFVHAGIRPGLPLEDQLRRDLRWIREPFLSDTSDHGQIVVHGHTIVDTIDEFGSRIGIDTGAYRSNVLTAIAVEGERRWYLSTDPAQPAARQPAPPFSEPAEPAKPSDEIGQYHLALGADPRAAGPPEN
ncbi:MAG: metallophosphoesterase family protein [Sphingosinicella sp.]